MAITGRPAPVPLPLHERQGCPRATGQGEYAVRSAGPPRQWSTRALTHIPPRTCVQSVLHRLAVHATKHRTPHAAQHTLTSFVPPSPFPLPPTPSFPPSREIEGGREKSPASLPSGHLHPSHVHFAHRPHDLIQTQLGIPTANLPVDATVTPWISDAKSGVYFGWAALALGKDHPNCRPSSSPSPAGEGGISIFPMVMSIGYNPFYNNTVRSAEVHVLDKFAADFYGVNMRLLIVGYIRDEKNYDGLDALIEDINMDCEVARRSLERVAWKPSGQQGGTLDGSWLTR